MINVKQVMQSKDQNVFRHQVVLQSTHTRQQIETTSIQDML